MSMFEPGPWAVLVGGMLHIKVQWMNLQQGEGMDIAGLDRQWEEELWRLQRWGAARGPRWCPQLGQNRRDVLQ